MFYIGYVAQPRTDDDGRRRARGEITIGNGSPAFESDLAHWTPSQYDAQWREGIARLATGVRSSALVTSYGGPDAAEHEVWSLRRDGTAVVLRRHLVHDAVIAVDHVADSFYALADRVVDNGAGEEWRIPFGQLLAFTVDA